MSEIIVKSAPETNPMVRFYAAPTRGKAIKAMCCHCMGCTVDHIEPGFRVAIRDCSSVTCPLYQYRPFQVKSC